MSRGWWRKDRQRERFNRRVAQNIRMLRRASGRAWSMKKLARSCGVTESCVSRWETGERLIDTYTVYRVARALNIKTDDLLTE